MKLTKIVALLLVLALSFSLFSCELIDKIKDLLPFGSEAGATEKLPEKVPEKTDYYSDFLNTAKQNDATGEYYYEEFSPEQVTDLKIDALVSAFIFTDYKYEDMALVYKFKDTASAGAFEEESKEKYKNMPTISVNRFDDVVVFGYLSVAGMIERGEVYQLPVLSDYSEYRDTRDTEGRDTVTVKITVKDYGEIVVLLDATTAPVTVANFTKLVSEGFYDGLTFHRVKKSFVIQGGDPLANGTGGSDEKIFGEFSSNGHENDIKHLRGTISMARGNGKDSASSQFFICSADSAHLDGSYAAFGYVISGLHVVDAITRATARYGDSNGTISIKEKQAVIEKIEIMP